VPKLKARRAAKARKSAERLEQAIKERMPERSLLGIVAGTAYWTGWWHRFGPASGNDPKLADPFGRYVLTTFVKGTNMTFAEAARHIPGITAHELSMTARRHATTGKLNEAITDVVNAHATLDMSRAAFREVGRVIRTIQLLRYLGDGPLRSRVTASTNKVEAFNGFCDWARFSQRGTVAANDPDEQEKDVKFTSLLLANLVIFHNTLDLADVVRELQAEGWIIDPLDLARISPYLTEHINRFGAYSTHEIGITPEDYDTHLDVDFSVLEDDLVPAA